jgi:putative two-component system response regulator
VRDARAADAESGPGDAGVTAPSVRPDSRESAPIHARVMVVDDDLPSLLVIERLLKRAGYTHVVCMSDPTEAEREYERFKPDILLLDLHMPRLGGFALLAHLRARMADDLVPVLMLTGDPSADSVRKALSSGARDFVAKPFEAVELILRVENLLESHFAKLALRQSNEVLEQKVAERTSELANAELATLRLLARAAEFRDDETGRHTQRVGMLAASIGHALGLPSGGIELLRTAAPLHDIGKIGIPDHILLKPGALTQDERTVMQRHAEIGADILGSTNFPVLRAAREIALSHHERWDGLGYPDGLSGECIPLTARIVAVADVFDALSHARPYRAAMDLDAVISMIQSQSGAHFDPQVVDAFLCVSKDHPVMMECE